MTEHTNLQERLAAALSALGRMTDQRDQLAAQLKDATAPEGWQLVPVKPTHEMVQAACDSEHMPLSMWARMVEVYRAMLAAAPKPEGQ